MKSTNVRLITYVLVLKRTIDTCTRKTVRNSDWSRCLQKMPACAKRLSTTSTQITGYQSTGRIWGLTLLPVFVKRIFASFTTAIY